MERKEGGAPKGKELLSEMPREVPTGGGQLEISNTPINLQTNHDALQDEKHGSLNTAQKGKWKVFKERNCKDANYLSQSEIKNQKIQKIIQNTKNQRKSSSRGVNSQMCHQCQRNDMGTVVNCTMCHKRRFCIKCITKWYPLLSMEEVAEKCPPCRGYCNCKHCLRNKTYMPPKRVMHSSNEVNHAWHVVQRLFPWITEFHERQNAEKLMVAEIKGFNACDLLIPKAKCKSEHICCYKCNSYIVDFHWSCCNCTCILCLSCYQELLNPDILITSEALLYVGSDKWHPLSDKEICEIPALKLRSVLGESFISKLYEDVNEIVTNDLQFDKSEGDISKCSCLIKSVGRGDLVCPMVAEVKEGDISHFQLHWVKGEPVIVRDVLEMSSGLSWDPMVMSRALRETKYKEHGPNLLALAVDCRGWSDMEIDMRHFFTGYQAGLCHLNGWPQLLRMKHRHSESSFAERSPRHEQEFLEIVPFPEYTDPRNGPLNLLSYLPLDKPIPQLGPMIDIAYGFHEELGYGDSVIKLHYDMNDVVNILMHTVEAYDAVMRHNIMYKLKKYEGQRMEISDDYGGALWDIWRREDVPKLRDYLTKNAKDFANHDSLSSCLADDFICYESVYLTMQHKRKLKDEYGVEPWTFEQNLGDAVLVPAGCPYQVRNLKSCINVTLGFISTESFQVCLGLADACRLQSRAKEDKLEVKKMAIYALQKATSCLRSGILKVRGNEQKVDEQTEKNQGFNGNQLILSPPLVMTDFNCPPAESGDLGQPAELIWQVGGSHAEEQAFECDRAMDQESAPNSVDVGDSPRANEKKFRKTLTDLQREQIYSALLEISSHGHLKRDSTERVAEAFNVNRDAVQRIWKRAKECRDQGVPVNVTSRKAGNCGRKKIDLDLSRVSSIPLNKRSTLQSLAEALGVRKSTLHRRFKEGLLQRYSSNPGSGPGHAYNFDTRVLTNSEFLELDGNAVSHSVKKIKPDIKQETAYLPCPELHEFNGHQSSGPGHANNFDTRVLTNSEFLELDGDSVPQIEPDNNIVTMDSSELVFHAEEQAFECDRPMGQESAPNSEDVGDSPRANEKKFRKTLTDLQREQIYSALLEISSHGRLKRDSTQRVAEAFNVNRRVVQRIWKIAKECRDQGVPVNVTSRKPGNCGRKKIDLDLSRVSSIPLNKRSSLRSLAEALGVTKSTLHKRFKEGLLRRYSSNQGSGRGHANNFDTRVLTNSEFLELDGIAVSHSVQKIKPDIKQETAYLPCPELHEFNGNQGSGPGHANNFNTRVLTNSEFLELDGDSVPKIEPDNNNVIMDSSELHDFRYYVPEPEFHDFDGDRVEKLFQPNQIWAVYSENDRMPFFYAFIQKVLSLSPFEVRMAFLNSHSDSEFGNLNWVARGFEITCGEFHLCQYETNTNLNMFSHQIKWEIGQHGAITIFPKKGDTWALYRNWSPAWNESTPDEIIYKYDIVEILDEYSEKNGITVAPLVKVDGLNAVFRKDPDPTRVKRYCKEEMLRFCFQIPSCPLTNDNAAVKAKNLTGCVELDPAATPLEFLEVGKWQHQKPLRKKTTISYYDIM